MPRPSTQDVQTRPAVTGRSSWAVFNATVFLAAACVMTVEILSTRLVARYLGSSLYTWTTAIGVVLAGISLGNYIGGRLADRCPPRRTLSILFLASSVACVTIPMVNGWVGQWPALSSLSWPPRIFWHFTLTFLLPSTLLGTISPVVAKMALDMDRGTGRTIGTIYAWSAIGSIVGTFAAGFLLVAWMGTERAILVVSGVLALVAIAYGWRSWVAYGWAAIFGVIMTSAFASASWSRPIVALLGLEDPDDDRLVFMQDSQYQRVLVMDTGGDHREMVLDLLIHSKIDLADPLDLQYEYEAIYAEAMRRIVADDAGVSALFLGGGGYVFPRYVELTHPGSHIEVAEIDPVVTRAAFEAFGLPATTAIRCFDQDARNRVSDLLALERAGSTTPSFDLVFGDAFADYSVPYHLTTLEFNRQLHKLMSDDGVYMLNLIDALESGRFLAAVVNTCRRVFPHVSVFGVGEVRQHANTFIVISAKRAVDLASLPDATLAGHGVPCHEVDAADLDRLIERSGHPLLTDDFAPVENLLAPVIRSRSAAIAADVDRDTREIASLYRAGRLEEVVARCRALLAADPSAYRARYWLGTTFLRQGKPAEAIPEFRAELEIAPDDPSILARLAAALELVGDPAGAAASYRAALAQTPRDALTRCDLARVLAGLGRQDEAVSEYRAAIRSRPGFARAHAELGSLLLGKGEREEALTLLQEAMRLDPSDAGVRVSTARVMIAAGRPADAVELLREESSPGLEHGSLLNTAGQALAARGDAAGAFDAFSLAVEAVPTSVNYRSNLALAALQSGRPVDAASRLRECLELDEDNVPVLFTLARLLATSGDDRVRNGVEAVRHAERLVRLTGESAEGLDTLASAYAEAGRFDEAVATATKAVQLAGSTGRVELAEQIRGRLELYRGGHAHRE